MPRLNVQILISLAVVALVLAGCRGESSETSTANGANATPARVAVIEAQPERVTIYDELPGRVAAFRTAEIRPQVAGIIERRLFTEGSEVEADQPLFAIAPDPFRAEADSAAAALQRAEAGLVRAQARHDRAKTLVESNAISRESYDDAVADLAQARADVAEARSVLQRRRLDLEFATVRAPIPGRIGQALVSEGALVSSANPLATVQQIDRVFVDLRQPSAQLDIIRETVASGQIGDASGVPVEILSASGRPYPVSGRALFSDITVDAGTGNVTVRVEAPNPDRVLLPGMYVRARLPRGIREGAFLVPQEAVVRDVAGAAQLVIVDGAGKAARRTVTVGEVIDGRYLVTSGLAAGEIVVVQGHDRAPDGTTVETVPFARPVAQTGN